MTFLPCARIGTRIAALVGTLLLAGSAHAYETVITTCNPQYVFGHATLGRDLDCSAAEVVNGSIVIGRGTLDLNGHTLVTPPGYGILCSGNCKIVGPGTITGAGSGIGGSKSLKVIDVDVAVTGGIGIAAFDKLSLLRVTVQRPLVRDDRRGDEDRRFHDHRDGGRRVVRVGNVGGGSVPERRTAAPAVIRHRHDVRPPRWGRTAGQLRRPRVLQAAQNRAIDVARAVRRVRACRARVGAYAPPIELTEAVHGVACATPPRVRRFADEGRARDERCLGVVFPAASSGAAREDRLERDARADVGLARRGIDHLDLAPGLAAHLGAGPYPELLASTDGHHNAEGDRLVATLVRDHLAARGLVPQRR
ncbi:MAG: hypothetical protein ABIR79_09180 [Candidatus Binatia bacterium]